MRGFSDGLLRDSQFEAGSDAEPVRREVFLSSVALRPLFSADRGLIPVLFLSLGPPMESTC